jgi:site-specific recombinase XerD
MMIRMALQTGLRREELATFPLAYVINPNRNQSSDRNMRVLLDPGDGSGMKTKGSTKRTIVVSRRLMQDLHKYTVQQRGERASLAKEPQKALFLNQTGAPWAADGKGIEAMVRKTGRKVGIATHPHMLRHTYATHTLAALQRHRGDNRIEPLVFLQKQLGHASIATTMIYLHLINELADQAVLAYDDELNEWLDSDASNG